MQIMNDVTPSQDPFLPFSLHNPMDNVPFLRDIHTENAIDINHHDVKMESKQREAHLIPNVVAQQIKQQISHLLSLPADEYAAVGRKKYMAKSLDNHNCDNDILCGQKGLFAASDLPAYMVIGIYAGYYLQNVQDFEMAYDRMNPVLVDRYMHSCNEFGSPAVSAYIAGNYMSYVNDWRPYGFEKMENLSELQEQRQNALSVIGQSEDKYFVAYVTIKPIWTGEEILTDYGSGYWEREDFIKKSLL